MTPHLDQLPELRTPVPGPRSRELAARLARVESRNVTCLDPAPIFWERARGANVWDVDDNRYVDLGAAFGVANVGHAHPRVVRAVAEQAEALLHGMGDVHPSVVKVELLEALARGFPGGGPARAVLGSSGSDAVEIALKTAALATGRAGVVAFEGGYHGLAIGALDATHRERFRAPFAARLAHATAFARFGDVDDVRRAATVARVPIGAVIVEPIQGRGGERVPPAGFLAALRGLCDAEGWLLIADEIYTGFGRTGARFACDHENVQPDLLCVGKGLASGMPISACIGRTAVMDAWPPSSGEALHTQTFLGHPPACAAALASLAVLEEEKLASRAAELGVCARERLHGATAGLASVVEVRGRGLLLGVECIGPEIARAAVDGLLARGVIALPAGDDGRVIALSPPLSIGREAFDFALDALAEELPVSTADPARAALDAAVIAWTCEKQWIRDDARFDQLALALFAFQFEHCAPYRRFCETRGRTPADVHRWQDVPAVPTGAFKELSLTSFPRERAVHVFRTSGTTTPREARGALLLDTLAVYEASLCASFRRGVLPHLAPGDGVSMRVLAPSAAEAPDSSLSHMFDTVMREVGGPHSSHWIAGGALDVARALRELAVAERGGEPLLLCGTAFAFVHLLEELETGGLRFALPRSARVMETGGFKGRSRSLPREQLYAWIEDRLGVPPARIVNQYGMTELGSQFYDSALGEPAAPRRKVAPPWTRVRILDPISGADATPGEPGRIAVLDLANTGSVCALETADLGRATTDGFEVVGRDPDAEERGCSIGADALLADARP